MGRISGWVRVVLVFRNPAPFRTIDRDGREGGAGPAVHSRRAQFQEDCDAPTESLLARRVIYSQVVGLSPEYLKVRYLKVGRGCRNKSR